MKEQQFKPYTPKQAKLMPSNLNEMIPEGRLVREVDEMIEMGLETFSRKATNNETSFLTFIKILKTTVLQRHSISDYRTGRYG
jgi:hypothetical protein